jgi:hypothetical protein
MRLLFDCDGRGFDEIMREGELSKLELVSAMSYLKRNRLVTKKKNETIYSLTERGKIKLAFYEFTFGLYKEWCPRWCEGQENGWQSGYVEAVTEVIRKSHYFGFEEYFK